MALPGYVIALRVLVEGFTGEQVQPAGVDLRVAEILEVAGPGLLGVRERRVPEGKPLQPKDGSWLLQPGAYRLVFADTVRVPEDSVGLCFPRSSLLRMGAMVTCAVWDPGYVGKGEALLLVFNPYGVRLEVGARVAQLILVKTVAGVSKPYSGRYLGERLGGRA